MSLRAYINFTRAHKLCCRVDQIKDRVQYIFIQFVSAQKESKSGTTFNSHVTWEMQKICDFDSLRSESNFFPFVQLTWDCHNYFIFFQRKMLWRIWSLLQNLVIYLYVALVALVKKSGICWKFFFDYTGFVGLIFNSIHFFIHRGLFSIEARALYWWRRKKRRKYADCPNVKENSFDDISLQMEYSFRSWLETKLVFSRRYYIRWRETALDSQAAW